MKPQNMKSVTRSATSPDQQGDRDLKSDGMQNGSSQGHVKNRFAGNQHGGAAGGNYGRGPTTGNTGRLIVGPATPPASGVPNFKSAMGPSDSINFGKQERTPGGTRSFDPKAGQNYSGNPDMITEGRGPTVGNAQGKAK